MFTTWAFTEDPGSSTLPLLFSLESVELWNVCIIIIIITIAIAIAIAIAITITITITLTLITITINFIVLIILPCISSGSAELRVQGSGWELPPSLPASRSLSDSFLETTSALNPKP